MAPRTQEPFSADRLSPEEIEALKQRERSGRDQGAETFQRRLEDTRPAYRLRAEIDVMMSYLALEPQLEVMDAGSGTGRHALLVAPRVRRLVCVDLSGTALDVLRRDAEARGIRNLETVVSDLCRVAPELGPFDTIYSVETIQHIPSAAERARALSQLAAALKPGGRLIVNVRRWIRRRGNPQEGFWGGAGGIYRFYYTPRELGAGLYEAGLRDVEVHGFLVLPGVLARRLPASFGSLERWLAALPGSARVGRTLIAVGRLPSRQASSSAPLARA